MTDTSAPEQVALAYALLTTILVERAGLTAVLDAIERRGLDAVANHSQHARGTYRVTFGLPDPPPPVSVVIPTRDAARLLRRCVNSIRDRTDYPRVEIVVVDNGSRDPESRRYLDDLSRMPDTIVVSMPGEFNFAALNNRGVAAASGSILALVNNDVEVLDRGWLRELVSHAVRPDVGCVGARLCYPDGRTQHAGIVLRPHDVADNIRHFTTPDDAGYFGRFAVAHEVSAVTAACLVVRRQTYLDSGGFDDEGLPVAYNDVDFCLRLTKAGLRVLFTPHALLQHDESATRGSDRRGAAAKRLKQEAEVMRNRWGRELARHRFHRARHLLSEAKPLESPEGQIRSEVSAGVPSSTTADGISVVSGADRETIFESIRLLRQEIAHELALVPSKKRIDRLFELQSRELQDLLSVEPSEVTGQAEATTTATAGSASEEQLRRDLGRVRQELDDIHSSKLWKLASLYSRALHALSLIHPDRRKRSGKRAD